MLYEKKKRWTYKNIKKKLVLARYWQIYIHFMKTNYCSGRNRIL